MTDSATGQTRKYYYDFLDRPVKYTEEGGTGLNSHAVLYTYDQINNLAQRQETVNAETWATSYTYDQHTGDGSMCWMDVSLSWPEA